MIQSIIESMENRPLRKLIVLLSLLILMLGSVSSAQDDRLQIVASHSILADVISNIVGDMADVTSTMPVGADPHSFEPVPSDLTTIADADIVFVNGAFFEEGLLEAIENADTDMNIVTVSSCVQVISFSGHDDHSDEEDHDHEEGEEHADDEEHDHEEGEEHADEEEHDHEMGEMSDIAELCEQHVAEMEALHEADEDHDHGDEEHADEEDHDHEHAHSDMETLGFMYAVDCGEGHSHEGEEHTDEEEHEESEDHDHGACDPHVWMEPHNVMFWTMLIRDTLVEADPANAETYTTNATSYLNAVDELAHDFVIPLVETVPEDNRIIITSHDSLGYFAARFDFEIATTVIPGGNTMVEPSTADIAEIIDLINEEGVMAIFGETTVNDAVVQTIADETGAELFVLYSGSLSESDGPASTYLDYMRYNVTTIAEALSGGM